MKDIGIIGSSDGPTSIYVSSNDENFLRSGGIVIEDLQVDEDPIEGMIQEVSIDEILGSKTLGENLDSGVKIMGLGMVAVFGVLTVLYLVVKIMGQFAKGKKDEEK